VTTEAAVTAAVLTGLAWRRYRHAATSSNSSPKPAVATPGSSSSTDPVSSP
jgi:hypothetical protein